MYCLHHQGDPLDVGTISQKVVIFILATMRTLTSCKLVIVIVTSKGGDNGSMEQPLLIDLDLIDPLHL
jgi:hypothetical protein